MNVHEVVTYGASNAEHDYTIGTLDTQACSLSQCCKVNSRTHNTSLFYLELRYRPIANAAARQQALKCVTAVFFEQLYVQVTSSEPGNEVYG